MSALQERHDKEYLQHMTEMKELQRIISHDDKIKKFMTIKASDRATLKAEESDKVCAPLFFPVFLGSMSQLDCGPYMWSGKK